MSQNPIPVAETRPVVGQTDGYRELVQMAEEFRAKNPFLSTAQAFKRIVADNPEIAQRERKERYARMGL